jgi:hypothetical protein
VNLAAANAVGGKGREGTAPIENIEKGLGERLVLPDRAFVDFVSTAIPAARCDPVQPWPRV